MKKDAVCAPFSRAWPSDAYIYLLTNISPILCRRDMCLCASSLFERRALVIWVIFEVVCQSHNNEIFGLSNHLIYIGMVRHEFHLNNSFSWCKICSIKWRTLLTPKFGKGRSLICGSNSVKNPIWKREGLFRRIRQRCPRSAIYFRSARKQFVLILRNCVMTWPERKGRMDG
jgi:hypothetical protein